MRLLPTFVSLALATDVVVGSSWFGSTAYNKWHETELERWLSDHDIPYPTPADRKDLEDLIQKNWEIYAVAPYKSWDIDQLTSYLKARGVEVQNGAEKNQDVLVSQVQKNWYETEDKAEAAWSNAKDWIFDTWTDSTLKSFADKHDVPVPQPRTRDTLLQKVRSNYEAVSKKIGQAAAYPGNWLWETWSESDLKDWLDTHGFPAPQPSNRDKLIASVRRNSRIAYLKAQDQAAAASASADAAYTDLTEKIIDAWGESQLKEFCDKNNINVPQGSQENELRALVRKHRAQLVGDSMSASASSALGAATSNANNEYAQATDSASLKAQEAFNAAVETWSESRLKSFLDVRGVPVPQSSETDDLRALVRKNSHKAASGFTAWTWDDLSIGKLKEYLASTGDSAAQEVGKKADATREDLVQAAHSAYSSASSAGGAQYASATSALTAATDSAKDTVFDTWTESELKRYLDSYGVPVYQGTKLEELKAAARTQQTYFRYGTSGPAGTAFAKLQEAVNNGYQWVVSQLSSGSEVAQEKAREVKEEL